ncbi:hypothetical protein ACFLYX_02710 [Chloroflexota bacterium]
MSKRQFRKTACEYIKRQTVNLLEFSHAVDQPLIPPLSEPMLLKEGLADPSVGLVASLKQLLRGFVIEVEIETHIVAMCRQSRAD